MTQTTSGDAQRTRTQVFIVRLWIEDLGEGKTEWRGQVKHVMSGEVRYFRESSTLVALLHEKLMKCADKNCLRPRLIDEGDGTDDGRDTNS